MATEAARSFYSECLPLRGGHPYLEAHGLDMRGCEGLKVDPDGWLVVPCLRGRSVTSVQRIAPDGTKRFWPGASVAGTTYRIERRSATLTVLCEGLATGLACFAAAPITSVVVAWNAGNLARLDMALQGLAVIAADNDHGTEERTGTNPGIEAARKAADSLGCGIAWPEGITGTDWSDYRNELVEERRSAARKYETEAQIKRDVDARIRSALMREAKYVARGAA
jgi:putative DNA primase/helicase